MRPAFVLVVLTAVIAFPAQALPTSEVSFSVVANGMEVPPAIASEESPTPIGRTDLPTFPCNEPCITTPIDQGETTVHIRAPASMAGLSGIASADWKPANEFNVEFFTFDADAEANIVFSAPQGPAIAVNVRVLSDHQEWEATWLVLPEATL